MQLLQSWGIILGTFQKRNITSFCLWCGLEGFWAAFGSILLIKSLNHLSDRIQFPGFCFCCQPHTHKKKTEEVGTVFSHFSVPFSYTEIFSCSLFNIKNKIFEKTKIHTQILTYENCFGIISDANFEPGQSVVCSLWYLTLSMLLSILWRQPVLSSSPFLKVAFWVPLSYAISLTFFLKIFFCF